MLEENNYLDTVVFLTFPNVGIFSDESNYGNKTIPANHFSSPQLSAQAQ